MSKLYKDADGIIHEVANNYNFVAPKYSEYSTSETVCGKWIDGKPLYRKVLSFTLPSTASTININNGITNLKEVVSISGCFKNSAGTAVNPIPQFISTSSGVLTNYVRFYASSLTLVTVELLGTTYASRKGYIILEYTKTTD